MTEIAVGIQYLRNLASDTRSVADALESESALSNERICSVPSIDEAYADFCNRWDRRRGELAEALRTIANSLETVGHSFGRVDADIAGKLQRAVQED